MKKATQRLVINLPSEVSARLRQTARAQGLTVSQVVLRSVRRGLSITGEPVKYRDLSHIIPPKGEIDFKAWRKRLAEMDVVNPDDWK